jgi:DNA-directed RNA polymerase specialized sigma24 family protein
MLMEKQMTLSELFVKYTKTKREADFSRFYQQFKSQMTRTLFACGYRDQTLLHEAVAWAAVQIYNNYLDYNPDLAKIETLAFKIIKNKYIKLYKQRNKLKESDLTLFTHMLEAEPLPEYEIPTEDEDDTASYITRLLETEAFKYLRLHYYEELQYTEIMIELGVNMSKVKNEVIRQKRLLRECLAQPDPLKRLHQNLPVMITVDDGDPILFREFASQTEYGYSQLKKLFLNNKAPFKIKLIE